MHPRQSRATSRTIQDVARRWRPQGATAWVLMGSLVKVYFGAGLSLSQAATHFRGGGNTWSASKDGARQVAQSARSGLRPVGPEKDKSGSGKHCHYHGNNRKPEGVHAFYGVAGQGAC
ncbi:hypothetical protein [Micrococcus endophyticus]|uniref:hypothetical protein n=1 Tax=Micrococcus endophyticus TaxID=455343 RepID=UPI0034CDAF4D